MKYNEITIKTAETRIKIHAINLIRGEMYAYRKA